MAGDVPSGLAMMEALGEDGSLDRYHLFHSARADLLRRLGRTEASREAYERALAVWTHPLERRFLERRLGKD